MNLATPVFNLGSFSSKGNIKMKDFNSFKTEWLERTIDYDKVYKMQCVDLILQYIYECYGINSGVSGNAIDYWFKTGINGFNQILLSKFSKVANSEAKVGDIAVLHGMVGNTSGHIGIATGNINATELEILEQNGSTGSGDGLGGNAIRVRYVPRSRVAGLLRPHAAPSPHAPPIKLPAVVHPYTVENITPKQVKLNKNTHLWGLNYDNFTAINSNPQADITAGTVVTVTALLHHNIGYRYYLTNPHVASGYNIVDCDPYTPPPPPPPPNPKPPAGPLTAPSSETYQVIKDVGGYISSNQAVNYINQQVTVPVGTYFVFNKRFDVANPSKLIAINVTKTSGKPGAWINPLDNVEDPVPTKPELPPEPSIAEIASEPINDFTLTYKPLLGADGQPKPQIYVAMRDVPVIDFTGKGKTITMPKYSVTWISGTFNHDGIEYALPKSAFDKGLWYGIEWFDRETNLANIELEANVFNAKTTVPERQATKTLKKEDHLALAVASLKNFYLGFIALLGKMKLAKKTKN